MKILKAIIKMIFALAVGVIIGLLIATIIVICFTDTSFADYLSKIRSLEFRESLLAAGAGVAAFLTAFFILIPIHEAGHLVCGLLSGYKFVSFRIFNITIIKIDGKIRFKKFAIAGTGGQCLLTPPELPLTEIPTALYNIGGVLANLIAVILIVPLLYTVSNPFFLECCWMFILSGVILILLNGIPMKICGTGNDGYNMLALRKDLTSKRGFVDSLKSNALIQNGVRPKDMPDEWFEVPREIDYSNQLQISIPLMNASRLLDMMQYSDALSEFEGLYAHKKEIIGLFVKEIACELVFLRLICGKTEQAAELLDKDLRKYIDDYRKMMSSKERILCAIALYLENNPQKAHEICDNLRKRQNDYLLQGEVKSDLAIMADMLKNV